MKRKIAALILTGITSMFVATAPAFALAVSCPGNQLPVVDSSTTTYDGSTGMTYTVTIYHCV
jgi:hypothetical protein